MDGMPAGAVYRWPGRCRQAAYRARVKARAEAAGVPALVSLRTLDSTVPSRERNGDAEIVRNGPKRSGLQLAYRRTYIALVDHFISRGELYPEVLARKILAVGLSARQRALLFEQPGSLYIHARNKKTRDQREAA